MSCHHYDDVEQLVDTIVDRRGHELTVALPLGLGKPVYIVNELVDRAVDGRLDELTIMTALSLSTPPAGNNELQRRLMEPVLDRLYGDVPDLEYVRLRAAGQLPDNITIEEFFHAPGTVLSTPAAQRAHRNVNFTDGLRMMSDADLDLVAQMVAPADDGFDLSCNTDLSVELLPRLRERDPDERPVVAAQVNRRLPRMGKSGVVDEDNFDVVLDDEGFDHELFSMPNQPVDNRQFAIGLRASSLLVDGGTIQIGIGGLGAALAWATLVRDGDNETYNQLLDELGSTDETRQLIDQWGGTDSFDEGLYSSTEMFVEGLYHLADRGILSREVDGAVLHGAFYLGSNGFYDELRELDDEMKTKLSMRSVRFTNLLYGDEQQKRRDRRDARFFNSAMMVTGLGGVVSDGLEDGRVVSGVGGQYEFVSQAHYLEDGRSIIMLPATRKSGGEVRSNIVWNYGHTTIPRHLRDIVITEYGIADLRGRRDEEIVEQLIGVCDARFQDRLVEQAKAAGKIADDFQIPDHARDNRPELIDQALEPYRDDGTIPRTPFGSSLTEIELDLVEALQHLKGVVEDVQAFQMPDLDTGQMGAKDTDRWEAHLKRMSLADAQSMKERVMRRAVVYGLRVTA